jgi:DNA-binding GntR family transcriptional regulator
MGIEDGHGLGSREPGGVAVVAVPHSRSKRLATTAYEIIKRDIIRCRLEPGSRVSKAQLIERYGLGEAAVREALSRLGQEQFVRALPREGYEITPVTLKQIYDLFETRLVIEPAVARLAAGQVDANQVRALDDDHARHFGAVDGDELEAYVSANAAFHLEIARATGNDRLLGIMAGLLDEMERVMLLSYLLGTRPVDSDTSHAALVEALIAGDKERAGEVMTCQLRQARQFVLDALLFAPSLQTVNLAAEPAILLEKAPAKAMSSS